MASPVDVANLALQNLGEPPVQSIDPPQDDDRARAVALRFNACRDQVLRKHPWNFAIHRAEIGASASPPEWAPSDETFYDLPGDCLRLLECNNEDRNLRSWRIEKSKVLTALPAPLQIKYIQQITDTEAWDPLAIEVLATFLSWKLAETLVGIQSVVDEQKMAYTAAIADARSKDGFEATPFTTDNESDYSWLIARRSSVWG